MFIKVSLVPRTRNDENGSENQTSTFEGTRHKKVVSLNVQNYLFSTEKKTNTKTTEY